MTSFGDHRLDFGAGELLLGNVQLLILFKGESG